MSQGKSPEELAAMAKIMEEHGYRVTKQLVLIQKNFEVEKDLWERVDVVREARNMLIREVMSEALLLWLERQKNKETASDR